jgi:hypothetical protein
MAQDVATIYIDDDSELARALEHADQTPVRLVKDGVTYRVSREDDLWANYDPEAVRVALEKAAGLLTLEEAETFKAYVYRAREEGSRPPNRP